MKPTKSLGLGSLVLALLSLAACREGNALETLVPVPRDTPSLLLPPPAEPLPDDALADPFPLQALSVRAEVSGTLAHVVLHQTFGNRSAVPVEAVYLFPLPHRSAVHGMSIRTGGRLIRARIQRRAQARAEYEAARDQGRTASLLEQERPDVFTQSVANLLPGDTIGVEVELGLPLETVDGKTEFVFPTVVGPRFCPPGKVPDMGRIGAPRLPPGMAAPQRLSLEVTVDAGLPVRDLASPTHAIAVRGAREGEAWSGPAAVTLSRGAAVPDRDFVLRWDARQSGTRPALLVDRGAQGGHFLLQLQPPARTDATNSAPKELVFLVDQSGSMRGEPLALVKRALRRCLESLEPRDRFQIVGFSNTTRLLAPAPLPATPGNVARGLSWTDGLEADGGTMMLDGLEAVAKVPHDPAALRLVAMMTDGYIGNEAEILGWVERRMEPGTRAFAFGTGSAVNRSFLSAFGEAGHGRTEFVTLEEDPAAAVERFRRAVDRPVLTDLRLDWHGLPVSDAEPARLPDLFDGDPLTVSGRFSGSGRGTLTVHGRLAGRPVAFDVPVDLGAAAERPAIGALWARARLERLGRTAARSPDTVEQLTRLALEYRLMSPWTSFVAVAESVTNRSGRLQAVSVPLPLPRGVGPSALGGGSDRLVAEGGASELRSVPSASSPSPILSNSVTDKINTSSEGMLGEAVDPSQENVVDAILAGGGGCLTGRGYGSVHHRSSLGGIGLPRSAKAHGAVVPPVPSDVELGGEAGARSPESVLRTLRASLGELRALLAKARRQDPGLRGTLRVRLTIAPSGKVASVAAVGPGTGSAALDARLLAKLRRLRFGAVDKGTTTVTYTFELDRP